MTRDERKEQARMLQHIDGACKWFRVLAVQEGYGGQLVERYHQVQAPDIRHLNYLFPLGAGEIAQVWEMGEEDGPGYGTAKDIVWRYEGLVLAALAEWDGIQTARQENEGRMAYDDLVVFGCGAYRTGMGTTWVVYNERTFSTWFENEVGQAALRLAFETASNAHYLKGIGHVSE